MEYRDILGFSKKQSKKKIVKEESKSSVADILKEEFGDIQQGKIYTYKDKPPFKTSQQIKEGPSYEYSKFIKKVDKSRDLFGREVLKFYELLRKKGLDKAAVSLLDNYKNNVIKFGKEFKQLVRKLL
tara:strand:+ start:160 stop:540 length:381 start_codon:yes stop_codon:yes gene_type:complete